MPIPPQTGDLIVNKAAVQALGKALFWDIQAGSDGQACASCHFHAGVDIRTTNQVNPGFNNVFDALPGGRVAGPNGTLQEADFPLYRLSDPKNRDSAITYQTDDKISSSGTFAGRFVGIDSPTDYKAGNENCDITYDPSDPFHKNGGIYRQVEPRQTPTVINAAFNLRQFWDGRANMVFNGVDPFGRRSNLASRANGVLVTSGGAPSLQQIEMNYASLASQAVGPPLSSFEMSCKGRKFADIGRKLLGAKALSTQAVKPDDSLFSQFPGLVLPAPGKGLAYTYGDIIRYAFNSKYWGASGTWKINGDGSVSSDPAGYSQIEQNFSLFWGIALMEYQRTLISNRSRFDSSSLSAQEWSGRSVFTGKGKCVNCHKGPLFTGAAALSTDSPEVVERMRLSDGGVSLYDDAFYNIGVRPTFEDLGVGGVDPYGNPLSFTRQYVARLQGKATPDNFSVDPCRFEVKFIDDILPKGQWQWVKVGLFWQYKWVAAPCNSVPNAAQAASLRVAVDGAFKTPTLRNIGLTPPYMHAGIFATLEQVVEFYNRGGNSRSGGPCGASGNTTGFGTTCSNRDADIQPLYLSDGERADLVAFLKTLTDDRVSCHSGPFDHPELPISLGHGTSMMASKFVDILGWFPATGSGGLSAIGKPCFPNTGNLHGATQTVLYQVLGQQAPGTTPRALWGSAGPDTLTGQAGPDLFKVTASNDVFVNFVSGEDKIDFTGTGIKSQAQLSIALTGNGLQVGYPGGSFLLQGIDWSKITANDVIWSN